jgi:AcrR family transcriptional regulator
MMATRAPQKAGPRAPLRKERVLRAAVELADKGGIESLSMRKLAQELGVEAMSLYNHVRDKEDILDGIVDVVVSEIAAPAKTSDWKTSLRQTVLSARSVLLRHPWAPRVIESRRNPSPATFGYFERVIGILRAGGFSVDQTHHALHVLGSRVLGFTQELFNDSDELASGPESAVMFARMAEKFPYMTEMAMAVSHQGGLGGCDDDVEFEFALDLILDGLERLRVPAA